MPRPDRSGPTSPSFARAARWSWCTNRRPAASCSSPTTSPSARPAPSSSARTPTARGRRTCAASPPTAHSTLRRQHPDRAHPRLVHALLVGRVRGRDVLARREVAVREHPDSRHHLCHHRALRPGPPRPQVGAPERQGVRGGWRRGRARAATLVPGARCSRPADVTPAVLSTALSFLDTFHRGTGVTRRPCRKAARCPAPGRVESAYRGCLVDIGASGG